MESNALNKKKAFVIHLPNFENSVKFANQTLNKLLEYNFEAKLYNGVDGDRGLYLLKKDNRTPDLYNIDKEYNGFSHRDILTPELYPGVVGCFYSHYFLWKYCSEINEEIFIFEDDVCFYRNYIEIEHSGLIICSVHEKKHLQSQRNLTFSSSGYLINPNIAKLLLKKYEKTYDAADWCILNPICNTLVHPNPMGKNYTEKDGKYSFTINYNTFKNLLHSEKFYYI